MLKEHHLELSREIIRALLKVKAMSSISLAKKFLDAQNCSVLVISRILWDMLELSHQELLKWKCGDLDELVRHKNVTQLKSTILYERYIT